ncbi:MAG TPA: PEP-CTERM sorting domain-containing protein [Phycisphaerae bacterium]|nr:PEP-CTERM sorting domain-containing protein [Phycisphaerae bacterium]
MRHLLIVGLLLAIVTPLSAQTGTIVRHLPATYAPLEDPQFPGEGWVISWCVGWDSWNGRSKPPLRSWNTDSEGLAAAVFSKTDLQDAINAAVATYGSWDAQILVTSNNAGVFFPVDWVPVVGSADVGSSTGYIAYQGDGMSSHPKNDWDNDGDPNTAPISYLEDARQSQSHRNAGPGSTGSWTDWNDVAQTRFNAAVLSGVPGGQSMVSVGPAWTQFLWDDVVPSYTAVIDAKDVVSHYINSDALMLFASGNTSSGISVYGASQWGGAADIRVQITPEPVSLALLAMGGLVALRRRR